MLERIKKIFKRKTKVKAKPKKVEEVLVLAEDKLLKTKLQNHKWMKQ